MKRITIAILILFLSFPVLNAQDRFPCNGKPVESNIQFSRGSFIETGSYRTPMFFQRWDGLPIPALSLAVHLSYGLDIRLDDNWSLMPGAALRAQTASLLLMTGVGADIDILSFADAFCTLSYHMQAGTCGIVFSLGPVASYSLNKSTYYIDADPRDPLNNLQKFHDFDYGLQPGVTFRMGKAWQWGLEATLGLRNMRIQYPQHGVDATTRFNTVSVFCGFHF
ncbi:MAG: hypothetical protein K6G79_04595 [Bacteroidales bacterium]|nr:hypothetical protein [Bacteroidales bacterium]